PSGRNGSLNNIFIIIRGEESINPRKGSGIFLSVHSPFVPVNPFEEGEFLQKGHIYYLDIQMEEEHLLESPYQTNCTDYVYIWEKNNKTGPRSQEMCREWCWWNFFQSCEDCEQGLTMVEKPLRHCNYFGLLVV
ncbi:uncharacterized protein NPIL_147261, partial [Nephila pilipes]